MGQIIPVQNRNLVKCSFKSGLSCEGTHRGLDTEQVNSEEVKMAKRQKAKMALSPYRILDLTGGTAMIGARLLGELGADVIKIERPGGSPSRVAPYYKDIPDSEKSLLWFAYNTDKRGVTLDVETKDGQQIFRKLVSTADVVMESFEPGYMDKLGLGYASLCQVKPDIIMTAITLFGQTGPKAHYKGCDLTAWSSGAMLYMTGDPDRPPVQVGFPQAFLHSGVEAASGTMTALYHRANTGEGQFVDVSTQECVIRTLNNTPPMWDLNRFEPTRQGTSLIVPPGLVMPMGFKGKDGYLLVYVFAGAGGGAAESIANLVKWMDEEGLAPDWLKKINWMRDYDASKLTQDMVNKVNEAVEKFTVTKEKMAFLDEAIKRGIMGVPIASVKDIWEFAQPRARDFWTAIEHPELNDTITYPGAAVKMSETPFRTPFRAPLIGEHNEEIYVKELGMSPEEFAYLRQIRVI